jgi:hypothetical protein
VDHVDRIKDIVDPSEDMKETMPAIRIKEAFT